MTEPIPLSERPPLTPLQREIVASAVDGLAPVVQAALVQALAPVVTTWDARSSDMLDVLAEAGDTRRQVRVAANTIKLAGWLGVLALVGGILGVYGVLERERDERRKFREVEQLRREDAAELVVVRLRAEARRIEATCAKAAQ